MSNKSNVAIYKVLIMIVCVILSFLSIMPFIIMFVNSTRSTFEIQQHAVSFVPSKFLLNNWRILTSKSFNPAKGFLNSLIVSCGITGITLYFSTLTAYALVMYDWKLKNAFFSFIMAIMMIPAQVSIIGFMNLMIKFGLYNTYWPLIIPAIAAPSTVYFMKQYMTGALSVEIIEAARIDGSGEFATFNKIALPLMKPAMATQAIFAFIASWNNLYTPTMMISDNRKYTLPMFITGLKSDSIRTDYGFVYVGLTLTVLPLLVVYFALSKYIIAGVALGGVKE